VKNCTDDQLVELIDQSLRDTAKDVREGRIPLDGRARLPLPNDRVSSNPNVPEAAE
jgi:hypothetical protein